LLRIELPRIELPRIELPRIELPRIELPRIELHAAPPLGPKVIEENVCVLCVSVSVCVAI